MLQTSIAFYTFENTNSSEIAQDIGLFPLFILKNNLYKIEDGLKKLIDLGPNYILGIGDYSGKDREEIRIETVAANKFRNNIINPREDHELVLSNWMTPKNRSKLTTGMGNSYCNFSAFRLQQMVARTQFATHVSFLHLPKHMARYVIHSELSLLINDKIDAGNGLDL